MESLTHYADSTCLDVRLLQLGCFHSLGSPAPELAGLRAPRGVIHSGPLWVTVPGKAEGHSDPGLLFCVHGNSQPPLYSTLLGILREAGLHKFWEVYQRPKISKRRRIRKGIYKCVPTSLLVCLGPSWLWGMHSDGAENSRWQSQTVNLICFPWEANSGMLWDCSHGGFSWGVYRDPWTLHFSYTGLLTVSRIYVRFHAICVILNVLFLCSSSYKCHLFSLA